MDIPTVHYRKELSSEECERMKEFLIKLNFHKPKDVRGFIKLYREGRI